MNHRLPAARRLPALPAEPSVSVVMPVRDAASILRRSVDAVLQQVPPVDEVVLAVAMDDASTMEVARELARLRPRVTVVDNRSGRTPDALNIALDTATGDVIVRVDAQSVVPAGYVATILDSLDRTGAANVGGLQVPTAKAGFARAVAAAMRSPFGSGGAAYRGQAEAGPVDTVYLGAFRREALDDVGRFDPRFTRNQDAELNQRLREAGYLVWLEPSLRVEYQPRGTIRGLARQYWQYGRWRRLNARAHRGSVRPRQLAAPGLVVLLLVAVVASVVLSAPWPFLAAAVIYLIPLALASVLAAPSVVDAVPTAIALMTMHLSWGIGWLVGPPSTDHHPPSRTSKSHG